MSIANKSILKQAAFMAALSLNLVYAQTLNFDEIYDDVGVMGFSFSQKVKSLSGKKVSIDGFMAPPLKAKSNFFVLTKMPMSLCPFCSSDTDWSSDIVVVYLKEYQTFVQHNAIIRVEGVLEYGSWKDENSGFVSLLRLREASFKTL
ncbi:MAG: hypothetical protein LBG21_06025 [Campylobacteraceae bacterium]|jgi:hypothetical protein|nr:hypothetical protein [Campylobacteraceae bacterium]